MALPIISISDFKGWLKISTNGLNREERLQEYIDLFYHSYLRKIIGDAAFLDAEQNDYSKYNDLLNGVNYVDSDGKKVINNGLLDVVKSCIYVEYQRDNFDNAGTGKVKPNASLSTPMTGTELSLISVSRWNRAECSLLESVYPFLRNYAKITNDILNVSNVGNTFTILTDNTLYLDNGNEVEINNVKYVVSNVVANVSYDIQADLNTVFPATYYYKPFELVEFGNIGIMNII